MSVTRGDFLKQLGKSLPGMLLGAGATTMHKLLNKVAAVSGEGEVAAAPVVTPSEIQPAAPEFIRRGPAEGNRVALTFDDGPTPGVTDRILDELKSRGLHATFFMLGQRIAAAPDLARRVLAEGHVVANHTFTHPKLSALPDADVITEIEKTQDIMAEVLGQRATWFRPPYGELRKCQAPLISERGMRIVMWNVDPADWSQPGEDKIIGTILRGAKAGSIIVCHDMHAQTADCVGRILDGLLERGLSPVTMSALME